ncbi:MAG: hypothetical protein QUU85_03050, partial [Candidatus Eisenbacteria bacterium]|nr:hypothetical protein [Candidatus Eisenbacteria bacterium]
MESRILEASRAALLAQTGSRAQIIDGSRPSPDRLELLLERGEGEGRARLSIDLAPARACLYLARPDATVAAAPDEAIRALLAGCWICLLYTSD